MKLSFINCLIIIVLCSGCGRNSFLLKKRYSKGFYANRSNKIKTECFAFSSYSYNTSKEEITITKQESELTPDHLSDKPSIENPTLPFKTVNTVVKRDNNFKVNPKKILKQINKTSYNGNDPNRHFFPVISLVLALAMLVTLTKLFGLMFTFATCFIITFTAISIFFIIRTHLN